MNNSNDPSSNSLEKESPQTSDVSDLAQQEELEFIRLSKEGDINAFSELVKRYQDKVYSLLYNLCQCPNTADDLTQQTLIKIWKGIQHFEGKSQFQTWVYRITHNVFYDHKKKFEPIMEDIESPAFQESSILDQPRSSTQAPYQVLETKERKKLLKAALLQLSEDQRNAIILKDIHDLSYKEIAEVTQTSVGTVMSRLHYGRQNLRTILLRHE